MGKTILVFTVIFLIPSCSGIIIQLLINTPIVSPSSIPVVRSPALLYIPPATRTMTVLPNLTDKIAGISAQENTFEND